MKKIILISVLSFSTITTAQTIDRLSQVNPGIERTQGLDRLQSLLSVKPGKIEGLETILNSPLRNDDNPITSSFFFKELMSNASEEMLRSLKYATPLAIDPSMSIADLDRKMEVRDNLVCVAALNKRAASDKESSDIDQLITQIMFKLALPSEKRKEKIVAASNKEELALAKLLQDHLQKAPRNKEGKTITQVIGDTHDLDWFGNRIRFIQFTEEKDHSKNSELLSSDKKIEMSLSMLTSIRTRQDEAFVRLQKCLVGYLTAQQNAFDLRLDALKAPRGEKKTSAQLFKDAKISDKAINAADLSKSDVNLATQLKFFFEGHTGYSSLDAERNFIEDRMLKNHVALRYLKERLAGALRAHLLLSKLSTEQLDYLINMFLQLNADDLVTPKQMEALQALVMSNNKSQATEEAFIYYRQMSRDLTALNLALIEQADKATAKSKDLKELEQIRPR